MIPCSPVRPVRPVRPVTEESGSRLRKRWDVPPMNPHGQLDAVGDSLQEDNATCYRWRWSLSLISDYDHRCNPKISFRVGNAFPNVRFHRLFGTPSAPTPYSLLGFYSTNTRVCLNYRHHDHHLLLVLLGPSAAQITAPLTYLSANDYTSRRKNNGDYLPGSSLPNLPSLRPNPPS